MSPTNAASSSGAGGPESNGANMGISDSNGGGNRGEESELSFGREVPVENDVRRKRVHEPDGVEFAVGLRWKLDVPLVPGPVRASGLVRGRGLRLRHRG